MESVVWCKSYNLQHIHFAGVHVQLVQILQENITVLHSNQILSNDLLELWSCSMHPQCCQLHPCCTTQTPLLVLELLKRASMNIPSDWPVKLPLCQNLLPPNQLMTWCHLNNFPWDWRGNWQCSYTFQGGRGIRLKHPHGYKDVRGDGM